MPNIIIDLMHSLHLIAGLAISPFIIPVAIWVCMRKKNLNLANVRIEINNIWKNHIEATYERASIEHEKYGNPKQTPVLIFKNVK